MTENLDIVDMVFDFNEQIIGIGEVDLNPLDHRTLEWTEKAYTEEIEEFRKAFHEQDIVGMVDANLDLIYFAIGTLKKMGLNRHHVRQCMQAVHRANMTKVRAKLAKRGDHENDAAKPEGFVPPEEAISEILFPE